MTAVVDQSVNSFLEHSLLVTDDDLRSAKVKELLKTVVSSDNSSIEVVKVGSSITSAVQRYHRTEFRRKYRNNIKYHPLGLVAGSLESFCDLESLIDLESLLCAYRTDLLLLELLDDLVDIEFSQEDLDSLSTHLCNERILAALFSYALVLVFCNDVVLVKTCLNAVAGIDYDVL